MTIAGQKPWARSKPNGVKTWLWKGFWGFGLVQQVHLQTYCITYWQESSIELTSTCITEITHSLSLREKCSYGTILISFVGWVMNQHWQPPLKPSACQPSQLENW